MRAEQHQKTTKTRAFRFGQGKWNPNRLSFHCIFSVYYSQHAYPPFYSAQLNISCMPALHTSPTGVKSDRERKRKKVTFRGNGIKCKSFAAIL